MREVALLSRKSAAGPGRGETGKFIRNSISPSAQHRQAKQHYFAFLSYSHDDENIADWLHQAIETYRVPKRLVGRLTEHGVVPRRLTPIFRDRGELAAANDLSAEIEEALAGSRFLIVLCSPAAVASRWTNAEIETFKRIHPSGEIFAAIVGGEPFASEIPGREAEECFPPALREKYDSRGRPTGRRAEPIAADLRSEEDKHLGLMQIIAGMLGVGLDDLVQRESKRRQRRMHVIAAASIVGMLFTTGLSLVAVQSRDAARDQRREAESLVAFMLGDLKKELEPIGKLDALGGVGSRVLDYYSKQDTAELSDSGLVQRSQALSLIAQVAMLKGDLEAAQQLYSQASHGTSEAVSRDPDDPQRLFEHAQNVFWIGDIARARGQLKQAEAYFREYKRLADRMATLEPNNVRWRMEAAYGDLNIGIVFRNQRRFTEAARQFARALAPIQGILAIDRDNAEYQYGYSTALAWAADAQRDLGHLETASELRARQIAFLRGQLTDGNTNVAFRKELIPAHQGLGILLASRGQAEQAIEQLRAGLAEADRLIPVEPENIQWKGLAAQARLELARTLLSLGRTTEAATEAQAGCGLAAQVGDHNPGGSWRHLRTDCLGLRSRLALQSGAIAEARRLSQQALASVKNERRPDPITIRYRIAAAYRQVGDVRRRMGDVDAARAAWSAALASLPRDTAERPAEMHERAEILKRLGRVAEARAVASQLAAIGFQRTE